MIYLGLGSNMGDREQYLRQAVNHLDAHSAINVVCTSAIYETSPLGYVEQAAFLNAVVGIETTLSPYELLEECLRIESLLDRIRVIRWGPRTIDIDILLFHDVTLANETLTIPHPFMHVRPFVLWPLRDLTGDKAIYQGKTASELLSACDHEEVTFFKKFDRRTTIENTDN